MIRIGAAIAGGHDVRGVGLTLLAAALLMWPVSAGAAPADRSLDRLVALVVERLDTADAVAAAKSSTG
ncbi:hypothetical protein [Nocardia sp. R7R-8]|uniref:hypothetical protein n=1 Tax=Nocardia sp. R7R-8 TaxID=3459304 RepID=UPI00403E185D